MPRLPLDSLPAGAAGLRTIAARLGVASAHLYVSGNDDRLRLAAAAGADVPDLAALAEALGTQPVVLDVAGVADQVRYAVGQRSERTALLVLGVEPERLDAAWYDAFADAAALGAALATPPEGDARPAFPGSGDGHARLLHEVATHPGTVDERLALALHGLTDVLHLDAAAFARVDGGTWTPEVAADPGGLLPAGPVDLATLPCAMTVRADGPVAIEDAGRRSTDGTRGVRAYLGAPVFVGGRTVGTLVAVGREARTVPFSADDRALAESLARWAGSALGGRTAARQLADREAALSAFVDRAPVAMGLTVCDGDDLRFVTVNTAAARLLGQMPGTVSGLRASQAGLDPQALRLWVAGCRHAAGGPPDESLPPVTIDIATPVGPRTLAVTLGRLDVHDTAGTPVACVSFVAEDVTAREAGLRASAESRRLADAVAAEQVALFERLHHDLRTPLTTILGYADLLGPDSMPDDVDAIRSVVLRSGRSLLDTLDGAVALAEASRVSVALVPTDAEALVRTAVDAARPAADAAGVAVAFEAAVAATPLLLDPAVVARVVRALVAEAVAAPGARHVDARLSEDGSRLVFDVGVRATDALRLEPAPAPLAPLRRLVERLGGEFDERTDGAWRWTVRLPRREAVVVEMPAFPGDPSFPGGASFPESLHAATPAEAASAAAGAAVAA